MVYLKIYSFGKYENFWINFQSSLPFLGTVEEYNNNLRYELKKYNGRDKVNYIEFDTEEDAIAFKLTWS